MIASLRGKLADKGLQQIVVDVGGVGYLVHVSTQTLMELPAQGESVMLRCHTHVREDLLQIFGFLGEEEQRVFEMLIAVSGIGPKLALTILSGMSVGDLRQAIADGDHRRLQTIPGVGKKTAERVVVELRDRVAKLASVVPADRPATAGQLKNEVVEALINLGYKRPAAEKVVEGALRQQTDQQALSAEGLLRASLAALSEQ